MYGDEIKYREPDYILAQGPELEPDGSQVWCLSLMTYQDYDLECTFYHDKDAMIADGQKLALSMRIEFVNEID